MERYDDNFIMECPNCGNKFKVNCDTCGYNIKDDNCEWNIKHNDDPCTSFRYRWKPKKK